MFKITAAFCLVWATLSLIILASREGEGWDLTMQIPETAAILTTFDSFPSAVNQHGETPSFGCGHSGSKAQSTESTSTSLCTWTHLVQRTTIYICDTSTSSSISTLQTDTVKPIAKLQHSSKTHTDTSTSIHDVEWRWAIPTLFGRGHYLASCGWDSGCLAL